MVDFVQGMVWFGAGVYPCSFMVHRSVSHHKQKNTQAPTTIRNHNYKKDGTTLACWIGGMVVYPELPTSEELDKDIMGLMKINTFDHMEHNQLIYHHFIRAFCEQANQ